MKSVTACREIFQVRPMRKALIFLSFSKRYAVYYDENVPLFRRNGYRKSGTMILRVRSCNQRAPTDGFAEQNGRDAERPYIKSKNVFDKQTAT